MGVSFCFGWLNVKKLKSEVSALSPRVAFLDHQRLILNVDNSALKQRIAALAQDKIFKDGNTYIHTHIYNFVTIILLQLSISFSLFSYFNSNCYIFVKI